MPGGLMQEPDVCVRILTILLCRIAVSTHRNGHGYRQHEHQQQNVRGPPDIHAIRIYRLYLNKL